MSISFGGFIHAAEKFAKPVGIAAASLVGAGVAVKAGSALLNAVHPSATTAQPAAAISASAPAVAPSNTPASPGMATVTPGTNVRQRVRRHRRNARRSVYAYRPRFSFKRRRRRSSRRRTSRRMTPLQLKYFGKRKQRRRAA